MPERPRWSRDAAVPNNWWPAGSRTKDNVTLDLNCDVIELALASSKFQYLFLVFSRRFRATFPIRVITGAFKWLYRCLLHVSSFLAFDLTQWKFTKCMWENWLLIFKILVFAFVVCLQKSFETRFSGTVYFFSFIYNQICVSVTSLCCQQTPNFFAPTCAPGSTRIHIVINQSSIGDVTQWIRTSFLWRLVT